MLQIPIQAIPSQIVKTVLNGQNCQIAIYAKTTGTFVDVNSNGKDIVTGVLALNGVPLVCTGSYMGFSGDLMFLDTQGADDPTYDGLGTRYLLLYLAPADIAEAQA